MANDENPTMKEYSNLEVYGKINQKEIQGIDDDSVLLYKTMQPASGTGSSPPATSSGNTQAYYKGQLYILSTTVGSSTVKSIHVCTNATYSAPTWTYTWEALGSPFAPSTSGTTGQVLRANSNSAPTWENTGSVSNGNTGLVTGGTVYTALTDGTVTKIGSSNLGGALTPIYLVGGTPTAGTPLYDKNITLNGSTTNHNIISKNNSFALSFYAPTTVGTLGQVLKSSGNGAPVWLDVDTAVTQNSANLVTSGAVWTAIDNLPEPMIFKGTVGTDGTISYADTGTATYRHDGWTFKAVSAGTVNSSTPVSTGDTIIYNGSEWVVIPSGDEPSGTVTNIATGTGLTGGPITTSGTISIASEYQTRHTVQTKSISTAGAYSITGLSFQPRIVQIFDPDGVQVNVRMELGSNSVTIRTAMDLASATTWTFNIIGW